MRIASGNPWRAALAVLATALLAVTLAAGSTFAQTQPPNTPPGVDHYLVYPVLNPPAMSVPIILSDQFTPHVPHQTMTLDFFMLPVNKNGEGIIDPVTHYTWWRIDPNPIHGFAIIANQFNPTQQFEFFESRFLLNPALKNMPVPSQIPVKNHFQVYRAVAPPPQPGLVVNLQDQFFQYVAIVDSARALALPAEKLLLATGQDYPIIDPVGHLAIYRILLTSQPPQPPPVQVQDEFGVWQLELGPPILLCVPSYKTGVTKIHTTTWGQLRKLYN